MNVFVLNTGRCGSSTFIRACEHIDNYSCAHESRIKLSGEARLAYPADHIEADNRLSWFLGRLQRHYADDAFYVHLTRDEDATVDSFIKRMDFGIMKAYREGILLNSTMPTNDSDLARDYIRTVNSNIELFLRDKTRKMDFRLENASEDFSDFFQRIDAEGDLALALEEWLINYNAS